MKIKQNEYLHNLPIVKRTSLTVQECADYLGVHHDTIYTMVREKQIPHFRIRKRIFFTVSSLEDWKQKQEHENCKEAM